MTDAKFITLEGVDGAGKSTHIDFIKSYFESKILEYIDAYLLRRLRFRIRYAQS